MKSAAEKISEVATKEAELITHGAKIGFFTIVSLAKCILDGPLSKKTVDSIEKSAEVYGSKIRSYLMKIV